MVTIRSKHLAIMTATVAVPAVMSTHMSLTIPIRPLTFQERLERDMAEGWEKKAQRNRDPGNQGPQSRKRFGRTGGR